MKTFSTSGTGNQQTLSEIESDKIPVYDSVADAEADLANLSENQIVATKDKAVGELLHTVDIVEAGNMHPVTSNAVAGSKSYFTEEHLTGAKWIDGKPIYSITIPCTTQINFATGNWVDITSGFTRISIIIASIDTLVRTEIRRTKGYIDNSSNVIINYPQQNAISIYPTIGGNINIGGGILLEYTKTTD